MNPVHKGEGHRRQRDQQTQTLWIGLRPLYSRTSRRRVCGKTRGKVVGEKIRDTETSESGDFAGFKDSKSFNEILKDLASFKVW